jgi:hypothetical protein
LATAIAAVVVCGCGSDPHRQRTAAAQHHHDARDAGKFALSYGKTLLRRGEQLEGGGCNEVPEESQSYECDAVFLPSERTACFKLTVAGATYRVSGKRPGRRFDPMDLSGACRR